jgi:hypothetical protein
MLRVRGVRAALAVIAVVAVAVNEVAQAEANRYYVPSVADPLSPITFVHKIRVPVFLACQWTDEETGGHCPALASRFTGTRLKWFTFTNGTHVDSLDPATLVRRYDFLSLFVAGRLPHLSPDLRALAPLVYQEAFGVSGVTLPADPIENEPTFAAALAAFEALPPRYRSFFEPGISRVGDFPRPCVVRGLSGSVGEAFRAGAPRQRGFVAVPGFMAVPRASALSGSARRNGDCSPGQ